MLGYLALLVIATLFEATIQCREGELRLVNGSVPNEGRVEVCVDFVWGTVCDDGWGSNNARVVCRQLGYSTNGAQHFPSAYFGPGVGPIVLDNVNCYPSYHQTLLDCSHRVMHNCEHNEDAGVRCQVDSRLKNITATIFSTRTEITAFIILWELQNKTLHEPYLFEIECFNEQHKTVMSVSNKTFFVQLYGLLSSMATSYTCCVLALYRSDGPKRLCTKVQRSRNLITTSIPPSNIFTSTSSSTPSESLTTSDSNDIDFNSSTPAKILITDSNESACNTVGGVLGLIIVILLILLMTCGIIIVCMLRPKCLKTVVPKRLLQRVDKNTTDVVPVRRNLSYVTTPSHSTTSGSQATSLRAADQTDDATAEYSRIGPRYETIDSRRQQPPTTKKILDSSRFTERYEFSEAHLTAMAAVSGDGVEGDLKVGMDYEVPQDLTQIKECEEYSHLQH